MDNQLSQLKVSTVIVDTDDAEAITNLNHRMQPPILFFENSSGTNLFRVDSHLYFDTAVSIHKTLYLIAIHNQAGICNGLIN